MDVTERLGAIVDAYRERWSECGTVYDVGSRDGDDAVWIADQLDATNVVCFEAIPEAAERIRRKHRGVKVVEGAVSDITGVTEFTVIESDRADHAGSSSIIKFQDFGSPTRVIQVGVDRMENLIKKHNLPVPDVVKVDVEGFSWECLNGFGDYLERVRLFHVETETFNRHHGHKDSRVVRAFMESCGFTCVDVSTAEWGSSIEDQVWVRGF